MVEVLNRKTLTGERIKPPTIQIYEKGRIKISWMAAQILGLTEKDKLEFILDDKDKNIVYFRRSENGFKLCKESTPSGKCRLIIACRPLAANIMKFFDLKKSRTYDITNDVADYYGSKCWFILKGNYHIPIT